MPKVILSKDLKRAKQRNIWINMVSSIISGFGDSCMTIAYMPFLYQITHQNLVLVGFCVTLYQIMVDSQINSVEKQCL